jgi:MFS family permease
MTAGGGAGGLWAPQRRALTAGLVLTVTLVAFEALAVITILPLIQADLHGLSLYGWVTSAFFLGTLVGIVVAGDAVDRLGTVTPFLLGSALFAAGLTLGGLAPAMAVLVAARALQGLGAGAIPAVAYASVGRAYPEALRPRVFAVMSTAWVVPGLVGPGLSALVATHLGWRVVFLGLLPLVVCSASLGLPALRRLDRPAAQRHPEGPGDAGAPQPPEGSRGAAAPGRPQRAGGATGRAGRLPDALRVAAGSGLVLAGLGAVRDAPLVGAGLAAAGAAVGAWPLLRLLPPGTLRGRRGVPAAVLVRGLLTFAFFGTDTFVPLELTAARGRGAGYAGAAVTAATLAWTAGAWIQERTARLAWGGRRLVALGFAVLALGVALVGAALAPAVPAPLAVVGWAVGGLGIGLAYSAISLMVLNEAAPGQKGTATAAMQLCDNLGVALGSGLGGAIVAATTAAGWRLNAGARGRLRGDRLDRVGRAGGGAAPPQPCGGRAGTGALSSAPTSSMASSIGRPARWPDA